MLRENRARKDASAFKLPPQIGQSNISKSNSTTNQVNVKPSKSYFNLEEILSKIKNLSIQRITLILSLFSFLGDPIKIRLYIDKLNNQLKEKDTTIKNLNENLQIKRGKTEREHVESLTQES